MHTWGTSNNIYSYSLGRVTSLQGCYKVVTRLVTRLLQGCYKVVTRLIQGCYKVVTRLLQGCYKVVTWSIAYL